MHLLEVANQKILLDCGLSFGNHPDVQRRNKQFPFAPDAIDAVVLSHAHVDHCGNLPNLVRQGFTGPIYCTPATRDLTAVMLADSAKIQEEDAFTASLLAEGGTPPRPLYTHHDADLAISQCVAVPYGKNQPLNGDVQLRFADAGHVLGSAMVVLTMNGASGEHTLAFTGDLGRRGLPFLHEPMPVPEADLLICESTYGGRTHKPLAELAEVLADVVTRTVERGGKVLVPAFSLGRAQIVVYYLQQWMDEGRLPRVPIYVDSPLACDIAEVYRRHTDCLSDPTLRWLGDEENGGVNYVRSIEESRRLSTRREPSVIVASGGMCEAGRVLHHLQHLIDDPRCSIVLVSYQSPQSLGQRLRERGPTVRFVGKKWNKWAEVVDLNGFSGHADHNDFLSLLGPSAGRTKKVSLVHGDPARAEQLATALRACGFGEVGIPGLGETVSLAS
ncbi:MAG TPA: MBL fold metallo-hydrolase [Gemmataceae bacterium]|nr:MBL fold metallo-hydrolase [Gemmataceae bacterium]